MKEFTKNDIIQFLKLKIFERTNLKIDDMSNDNSLEEIGLGSLDVVLISGELEDEFEVEIDPIMMFESKTLDEVANRVIQLKEE